MGTIGPSMLQDLCLLRLAGNIKRVSSLEGLPEDIVCQLFELVILNGQLSPEVLQLFKDTEHDRLLQRVKSLKLQTLPPRLPMSRNLWLGQHPSWY